MEKNNNNEIFYHYNASFNPVKLIRKYAKENPKPAPGLLTNAFGVVINPKFLPQILKGKEGQIEGLPIPSNWHADIAEFGAALRAVSLANESFTMVELGCGWGCWMNITGVVAKRRGLKVTVIGVEGDEGHIGFAKECLRDNHFEFDEYRLHYGIAAASTGYALFPLQNEAGISWGLEPIFDSDEAKINELIKTGQYAKLRQYSLEEIAKEVDKIDLLHVDIQGGEEKLIPSTLSFLNKKVAYLLIGTHSRQIEGLMFDYLLKAGWILEIERPAILSTGKNPYVTVDGVQGWRNPKLTPGIEGGVSSKGSIIFLDKVEKAKVNQEIIIKVKITNRSATDWESIGSNPIYISYHWLHPDGSIAIFEGERTKLLRDINAGEVQEQLINVISPPSPGNYTLCLTLLQEGLKWFDKPDFEPAFLDIVVFSGI